MRPATRQVLKRFSGGLRLSGSGTAFARPDQRQGRRVPAPQGQRQRQPVRSSAAPLEAADLFGQAATAEEPKAVQRQTEGRLSSGSSAQTKPLGARRYRPKIAVDIDEVLAQFLLSLNSYYADRFGKQYHLEHYDEYYFCKVWNCSPEMSNDIVHQFFDSHFFRDGIAPVPGALEALQALKQRCELVVVTSRQNHIREATTSWVEAHYPGIFSEMHFCNHFALEGESFTKAEVMKKHGIDLLIDDNKNYALESAEEGLDVILFGSYPWNQECATHTKIKRCGGWDDVHDYVKKKYVSLPDI
mmetsp:Transcript_12307/g.31178  ORF Transcript_12307/g.31178 Transcript_12307/m.31178 type:complete len:301 (-) Transcript_12307:196-1098(-)